MLVDDPLMSIPIVQETNLLNGDINTLPELNTARPALAPDTWILLVLTAAVPDTEIPLAAEPQLKKLDAMELLFRLMDPVLNNSPMLPEAFALRTST